MENNNFALGRLTAWCADTNTVSFMWTLHRYGICSMHAVDDVRSCCVEY